MKQQTAVEWLIEKLYSHSGHIDILDVATLNNYWEKAKQMQKHQHTSTFFAGKCYIISKEKEIIEEFGNNAAPNFEQYYKETYGK